MAITHVVLGTLLQEYKKRTPAENAAHAHRARFRRMIRTAIRIAVMEASLQKAKHGQGRV